MKKTLFLLVISCFTLIGCSSDDSSGASAAGPLVKTMVIDNINPGDDDFNLAFSYSGNKLKTVKDSGVLIEEYRYSGDRLVRIDYPEDGLYTTIDYNSAGQVIRFTEFDTDFGDAKKFEITYSGSAFTRTVYSGNLDVQTQLQYTEVCSVQNGNVVQIVRTSAFGSYTENYGYDTKNNPFKNISNYSVFQILDIDIEGNPNNNISSGPSNPYTVTIAYNSDDYPTLEQTYDSSNVLRETSSYTYY